MKKRVWLRLGGLCALILSVLCLAPFLYVLANSFRSEDGVTLTHYYTVFLSSPKYLLRFWLSLGLACCIAGGQVIVSALSGYGFAKCRFKGRNALFFALTVLMILPLQVTLVPTYLVLDGLALLDTSWALILPAVFLPLGTFLMAQGFRAIPDEILDAARLDGCGTLAILVQVAVPMNKSGLVCTLLLSFLDGWNMVEQPIAYLKDFERWPLSVSLASVCLLYTSPSPRDP